MAECDRDVLDVLKSELQFLEGGGYQWCLQKPWRPPLAFIESRTCPRHGNDNATCNGCALRPFVPADALNEKTPCWHIPLNEDGQTVDSLYRRGNEEELNQALKTWLWSTILCVEDERRADRHALRRQAAQRNEVAPQA